MEISSTNQQELQELTAVEKYLLLLKALGWLLPALMLAAGMAGGLNLLLGGEAAFGTSDAVPWGLLIAAYVLLAVTCSGLCLVSSLGHVFRIKRFEIIGSRAIFLAVLVLLSGFAVLAVELGHPLRLLYIVLSPNLSSGIWWMGTIYGIYFIALVFELYFMLSGRHRLARETGMLTVVLATAATTNLGSVFGLVHARPFWYGAYWPVFILLTAVMSGTAALIILSWLMLRKQGSQRHCELSRTMSRIRIEKLNSTLAKMLALLAGFTGVMTFWNLASSLYGGVASRQLTALALLKGPLAPAFWILEIGLGVILPLVLVISSKGRRLNLNMLAACLAFLGIIFMRYDMVIAGQVVTTEMLYPGNVFSGFASYLPSIGEVAVLVGALGFIILAYRLGERFLQLDNAGAGQGDD